MIRLAFLGVLLIGGLIAFGAFYLVRGSGNDLPQVQTVPVSASAGTDAVQPDVAVTTDIEKRYFLRDLDMGTGEIALVLFDANGETLVVRDSTALTAARDQAYINSAIIEIVSADVDIPATPRQAVGALFVDDLLTYRLMCIEPECDASRAGENIDLAGLLDTAIAAQRISDQFDTYDDYRATIDAISSDPDFMFLSARPDRDFPLPRTIASMELSLPTVIAPRSAPFDITAHEILVTTALSSALPDDASLRSVAVVDLGTGVIGDGDNNAPVLAGGAPIGYPDVGYYAVSAWVDGAATLDTSLLETLAQQTTNQTDFTDSFATFVRDRLQSSCDDCFLVLIEGGVQTTARIVTSTPESYDLEYFDLRDTP